MLLELLRSHDLAPIILGFVPPKSLVLVGAVSREVRALQRQAILNSPWIMVASAALTSGMIKRDMLGFFGITSEFADTLPRFVCRRVRGGKYFLYQDLDAFARATGPPGSWDTRMKQRGVELGEKQNRLLRRRPRDCMRC